MKLSELMKQFKMNEETGGDVPAGGAETLLTDDKQDLGEATNEGTKEPEKQHENKQENIEAKKAEIPEKYEFVNPDGFQEIDKQALATFEPLAKELGLSNEQAQKLVNLYGKNVQEQAKIQEESYFEQRKQWVETLKTDKDFGDNSDDSFKLNVGYAQTALQQFGSPELKGFLNESGMGDNTEVVKLFARIGKALGEDKFIDGNGNGGGNSKSAAEILFDGK